MFWIKKIRPLSGTDIKFRNHPVSPLKQARFCNVPAYATSVTGSTRENLLTCLKLSAFLLRDDIQSESKSVALANGSAKFTVDSVRTFMKTLTGQDSLVKVIGVLLARLGLIWNSMPLCEEITGAK